MTLSLQSFGGQILSVQLMGKELFYCPALLTPPPTPTRGGVPILFPQFANQGSLPKHGYVRTLPWQTFTVLNDCVSASLLLTEQPDWPHRAQLNLDASVDDDRLDIYLEVRNVGTSTFEWTGGLHPYFAVQDVLQCQIKGLPDLPNYDVGRYGDQQLIKGVAIDEHHPISDSITLSSPHMNLRLEQKGFNAWQIWNPSNQHNLTDIPQEDWQAFLCVEPILIQPISLVPDQTWIGQLSIHLL